MLHRRAKGKTKWKGHSRTLGASDFPSRALLPTVRRAGLSVAWAATKLAGMKRSFSAEEPELMDQPQPVTRELEIDLENLRKINRYFGSHSLLRPFLRRWFEPGRTFRVLDLCTASGDLPRMMIDWARSRGIALKIDAVEMNASILEIARRRSAAYPEINFIHADALHFAESLTYDLVHCSLALHHFSEENATRLLRHMRELSHDKVLASDLERSAVTQLSVWLLTACVFREPMTRHDGRLSARRAFSFWEFAQLADAAGWENFEHRRFFPARQAMWMSVREEAPVVEVASPALDFAT